MKLEGSLDAFSLPDVFQLLSLTKKSGGLHLANGQARGIVYFASGVVTGASSDASMQSLARRIVGLDACDDAALRRAVERATAEDVGVARALAEAGAVDPDLLNRLALEETIDSVFDLLRWTDGDFAFGVDESNPDDVGLAVAAEHVVAEATARRETWDAVSRIIPSPEVILTMPVVVAEPPAVGRDEWALLALVDGHRSVGELVEVSGAGQFAVVSTLATLVQRGMLVLQDDDSPDHVTRVRRRQLLLAPLETAEPAPDPVLAASQTADAPAEVVVAGSPAAGVTVDTAVVVPVTPTAPTAPPIGQPGATEVPQAPAAAAALATSIQDPAEAQPPLGGAHDPINVVPPRPEPFMPKRVVDHPEPARSGFSAPVSPPSVVSATSQGAAAAAQPMAETAIERDPTVNRSLMLRLIAGVRGL